MFTWEIMSWLFKNTNHVPTILRIQNNNERNHVLFKESIVTVAWLNFDHAQSNNKNSLKAKKIKLPQMKFSLEKQKFHVLISPFHSAKFLKNP